MRRPLILLFALLLFGCDEELTGGNIDVLSVDYSECKNEKSGLLEEYIEKYIVSYVADGVYQIKHENAMFNCCLSDGIDIEVFVYNDTICFSDREKTAGICNCICPYDALAEVGNVEKGKHVLCFKTGDVLQGSVELDLKKNLYEEILVSELTDN